MLQSPRTVKHKTELQSARFQLKNHTDRDLQNTETSMGEADAVGLRKGSRSGVSTPGSGQARD